uniref:Uncharacterized protein n=1 Tax=Cacopsylla melanoneura TaxID=428564 RepID=A0A8D8SCG1_9HEMI
MRKTPRSVPVSDMKTCHRRRWNLVLTFLFVEATAWSPARTQVTVNRRVTMSSIFIIIIIMKIEVNWRVRRRVPYQQIRAENNIWYLIRLWMICLLIFPFILKSLFLKPIIIDVQEYE